MTDKKHHHYVIGILAMIAALIVEQLLLVGNIFAYHLWQQIIMIVIDIFIIACFFIIYNYLLEINHINNKSYYRQPIKKIQWRIIIINTLLLLIWQIIASVTCSFLHLTKNINQSSVNHSLDNHFMLLMVVVIAPILEELMFRGYFFATFHHNQHLTLIISSLCFSIAHCIVGFEYYNFIIYFVAGLILGKTFLQTKDIRCDIVVHIMNNFFSILL